MSSESGCTVRIRLATYSCNGYEFVSYCGKLPDI